MKKLFIALLILLVLSTSIFAATTEQKGNLRYSGYYVSWGGVKQSEEFISNIATGASYNWAAYSSSGKMGYGMDMRLDVLFNVADARYLGFSTLVAPAIRFPMTSFLDFKVAVGPELTFNLNLGAGTSGFSLGVGGDLSIAIMPPELDIIGIEIGVAPKLLFNLQSLSTSEEGTSFIVIPYVSITLGKYGRDLLSIFK